jgi:DNA topoisomerase-1
LERIRALGIPPAYGRVWISSDPASHIQATAEDAAGKTHYYYHPEWNRIRRAQKFNRMADFGQSLGALRKAIAADSKGVGLPKEKVLSALVALLDRTAIRIGNLPSADENDTYGLTTLRKKDIRIQGPRIRIRFTGKAGRKQAMEITDADLAHALTAIERLPGTRLFQYRDARAHVQPVSAQQVNDYVKAKARGDFSAKDFRTWKGNAAAMHKLRELRRAASGQPPSPSDVTQAIAAAARKLGNSPEVSRKSYVDPEILDLFLKAPAAFDQAYEQAAQMPARDPDEAALLLLLHRKP